MIDWLIDFEQRCQTECWVPTLKAHFRSWDKPDKDFFEQTKTTFFLNIDMDQNRQEAILFQNK